MTLNRLVKTLFGLINGSGTSMYTAQGRHKTVVSLAVRFNNNSKGVKWIFHRCSIAQKGIFG